MVLCISYRMKQLPWGDSLSFSISSSHFSDRSTKEHKRRHEHSLKRIVRKSNEWNRNEKEKRSQHIVNFLTSTLPRTENKLKCQLKANQIRRKEERWENEESYAMYWLKQEHCLLISSHLNDNEKINVDVLFQYSRKSLPLLSKILATGI